LTMDIQGHSDPTPTITSFGWMVADQEFIFHWVPDNAVP
jgi:hypothetical protein